MQAIFDTPELSIADGIYQDILVAILMGEFRPLEKLPTEHRLSQDYGVSRTVVRSALEQLKREGVLHSKQGSSTVVADFGPQNMARIKYATWLPRLRDCFACRQALEPEIAASLARRPAEATRQYLEDQLQRIDAQRNDTALSEVVRSSEDAQFHVTLSELSGNAFFAATMKSMRPYMLFAMNVTRIMTRVDRIEHLGSSLEEHQAICRAILDGDPKAARDAMHTHISRGDQRIFGKDAASKA